MDFLKKASFRHISILCILFLIVLLVTHSFVWIYFDDYGYASLSYLYHDNTNGMNYTLRDILHYLKWQYFNWSGRVFYPFFYILALKSGIWFIQLLQAIVLFFISFVIFHVAEVNKKTKNFETLLVIILAYFAIPLSTFNEGIYWYAASATYVWSLLPFFMAVYIHGFSSNFKFKTLVLCFLYFCASFSMEQVSVLVVVYLALSIVNDFFVYRKIKKFDICYLFISLIGASLMLLAPGNSARASTGLYEYFYNEPFVKRTISNFGRIIQINFGKETVILTCFLIVLNVFSSIEIFLKGKSRKNLFSLILSILSGIMIIVSWKIYHKNPFFLVLIIPWIIHFSYTVFIRFFYSKRYVLFLYLAGVCSQMAMIISPTIPFRNRLCFMFILHLVGALMFMDIVLHNKEFKIAKKIILFLFAVFSVFNFCWISKGYYENRKIQAINHYKLLEKSARIKAGENVPKIILYKLKDDRFASPMAYNIEFYWWILHFYDIPLSSSLVWETYNKPSVYFESVNSYFSYNLDDERSVVVVDIDDDNRFSAITFAVWSEYNGQDDLCWYTANKNLNGIWEYEIDLKNHSGNGKLYVHVYSSDASGFNCIGENTILIDK